MHDLTATYAEALDDDARRAQARRAQDERDVAEDLKATRRYAVKAADDMIFVDTAAGDWQPLAPDDGRAVVYPFDVDQVPAELALAFRHRGVTAGGPVLTVLARAADGEWVGARTALTCRADLPGCIADAIDQAERWDDTGSDAPTVADEDDGPAIVIQGDTLPDVLARAIIELVNPGAIDTDR